MSMFRRLAAPLCLVLSLAGTPAFAQDAADFVVRLGRLEGQMRQMAGQIEQLQFENRQLKEQLRKFQEDVEFRFQEGKGGAQPRPSATPGAAPAPTRPHRRSDAFDPSTIPGAPGAPQALGSTTPSAPLPPRAPAAVAGGLASAESDMPGTGGPLDINELGRLAAAPSPPAPSAPLPGAPSPATAGAAGPRADYEAAYASLQQRQYEQAEMAFRQFLQSHPRDKLASDATYWLGESYLQRGRHREAAEQFLKVSTHYSGSAKAPEAMLKLGVSLNALGAREQACATLAELERKYPQAGPGVRQGVEREQKRARCTS